jgi:hypothetical protein
MTTTYAKLVRQRVVSTSQLTHSSRLPSPLRALEEDVLTDVPGQTLDQGVEDGVDGTEELVPLPLPIQLRHLARRQPDFLGDL